ncbi:MAG: VOC family protein [Phaeospirillum sp.]|nr:VOC family protein [Phaeospirillum sp.]
MKGKATPPCLDKLGHVSLSTTNVPRALEFWIDTMGGRLAHQFRNDKDELYGFFVCVGGGTFLEIFNAPGATSEGGLFRHLCLTVNDIGQWVDYLTRLGHDVKVRRGRTDHILQLLFHDPDGTMIELQQHDDQSVLLPFMTNSDSAGQSS